MSGVENLYKMRVQAGTWQPVISSQPMNELAALAAKIDALAVSHGQGGRERGKGKNDRNGKHLWKYVMPKYGEAKSKIYDNRQYHWCPTHDFWTMLRPEQFKGLDYKLGQDKRADDVQSNASMAGKEDAKNAPVVKVSDALFAYIESTSDDSS
jgi:hypothetical protein